jgi:signal peptidase I
MSAPQTTATTSAASPRPRANSGGGVKDTIESILVAFILAFVFRAFVVEAFVIPTGSMATTLLGAHTRFHCPDCGYDFDVNYSAAPQPPGTPEADDPPIPPNAGPITNPIFCPNCGFHITDPEQTANPPVFYGDRLLVLKYLYLLQKPQRWDVVVFKAPVMMNTNYIKRLIATPGETVMVLDGDIYIREPGDDKWIIQPKPKPAQDALWRLVYDNDFHPAETADRGGLGPWTQPWSADHTPGWNLTDPATHGRKFTFANDTGSSTLTFNSDANPNAQTTGDYLAYDGATGPLNGPENPPNDYVSDLDLRLTYRRVSGAGPLKMQLTKRGHTFVAEITPTQAVLFHDFNGRRTQIGAPMQLVSSHSPMRIELSNADYQATLRVDDKIVAQSTPADFAPDISALINEFNERIKAPAPVIEIAASSQQSEITHLSLWRDVFYYNRGPGVLRSGPGSAVTLGADEYFTMGDNSAISSDARFWDKGVDLPDEQLETDAGRVPGRFLLGKAFYVYWPAGFQANSWAPAFVPNFGKMRFIH